jgi:hypothetical protein
VAGCTKHADNEDSEEEEEAEAKADQMELGDQKSKAPKTKEVKEVPRIEEDRGTEPPAPDFTDVEPLLSAVLRSERTDAEIESAAGNLLSLILDTLKSLSGDVAAYCLHFWVRSDERLLWLRHEADEYVRQNEVSKTNAFPVAGLVNGTGKQAVIHVVCHIGCTVSVMLSQRCTLGLHLRLCRQPSFSWSAEHDGH